MRTQFNGEHVVLVIDDSPDTLALLNEALENAGMTVLVALEGRQGINIASKMQPDIILLDAMMPNLDGFETCKKLKSMPGLADIPVVFMTGLSDTESIVQGLAAGGVDYVTKPVKPDELIARIRVHLANARLTSSAHSALDSTGQHLLTVNAAANIIWATPRSRELLDRARATDAWQSRELAPQLLEWFGREPEPGMYLDLRGLDYPLRVKLVEWAENGEVLLRLIDAGAPSGAERLRAELPLTQRESEVLYWIGQAKTNREIGQILGMSPRTVNKHLEQIFRKLDISNRTSAAAVALKTLAQ